MPRRNRNAHAPATDTDELAAQADQLTAELGSINGRWMHLMADEIQLCIASTCYGTGKSSILRDYLIRRIKEHPLGQLTLIDATAVAGHGRD